MQRSSNATIALIAGLAATCLIGAAFASQSQSGHRVTHAVPARMIQAQATSNTHICVVTLTHQVQGSAPVVERLCITGSTREQCNTSPGGFCDASRPAIPGMTQTCSWVDARVCDQAQH